MPSSVRYIAAQVVRAGPQRGSNPVMSVQFYSSQKKCTLLLRAVVNNIAWKLGETVRLEKLDTPEGESVTFDKVMMIGDGADMQIGTPLVEGGSVTAEVISHGRGDKIRIIKIKRRKHSRKQAKSPTVVY